MVVDMQEADLPRVLLQYHDQRINELVGLRSTHSRRSPVLCSRVTVASRGAGVTTGDGRDSFLLGSGAAASRDLGGVYSPWTHSAPKERWPARGRCC